METVGLSAKLIVTQRLTHLFDIFKLIMKETYTVRGKLAGSGAVADPKSWPGISRKLASAVVTFEALIELYSNNA